MQEIDTHYVNLSYAELVAHALDRQEGRLSAQGVLTVETGHRTGRSPKNRFIVCDQQTQDQIDWGTVNQPMQPDQAEQLWSKGCQYLEGIRPFLSHLKVGAHDEHHLGVDVVTEYAWHHIAARNLFIRPEPSPQATAPRWTLLNLPGCVLDPQVDGTNDDGIVIIDFTQQRVLLLGMRYAGEMKKAMFTALNYLLPPRDVLPMHCAANTDQAGENTVLFFGLSGTGKTTLSSDPNRLLMGDDEHGWSPEGVFNFEGGCYAKCIRLSPHKEPAIHQAIKIGAVMENVVLDPVSQEACFDDDRLTQNTRVAYPREHIERRVLSNQGPTPHAVIFLTCDLFGVLPPVSKLSREQAAYYFLNGYTALVGSTEMGSSSAIQPTFSACFGAPFFPRKASVYASLLMKRLDETGAPVYLVNTGWTGGCYGQGGERFDISTTRAVVDAITQGTLTFNQHQSLPGFDLLLPDTLPEGVSPDPRTAWQDTQAYEATAAELIELFQQHLEKLEAPEAVRRVAPQPITD